MSGDDASRVDLGVFGWLNRLLILLIIAAACGVVGLKYVPLIRANVKLVHKEQELKDSVAAKRTQSARLAQRLRQLRENPRVIEREARAQLGLARPDEMVLWITARAPKGTNGAAGRGLHSR